MDFGKMIIENKDKPGPKGALLCQSPACPAGPAFERAERWK